MKTITIVCGEGKVRLYVPKGKAEILLAEGGPLPMWWMKPVLDPPKRPFLVIKFTSIEAVDRWIEALVVVRGRLLEQGREA